MNDRFFVYAEKKCLYGKDLKMQMFLTYKAARAAYNAWLKFGYGVIMYQGATWEQRTPIAADIGIRGEY